MNANDDSAIAAMAGEVRVDAWQPISNFPRVDGSVSLFMNCDGNQHVLRYIEGNDEENEFWELTGFEMKIFHGPTHWMPLPNPPEDK